MRRSAYCCEWLSHEKFTKKLLKVTKEFEPCFDGASDIAAPSLHSLFFPTVRQTEDTPVPDTAHCYNNTFDQHKVTKITTALVVPRAVNVARSKLGKENC